MASSKSKSAKTKSSKGKEKKKLSKKSKQLLEAPDAWINELADLNINDEEWQCFVALMEEESIGATVYLEHFNESAIKGRRLAMKVISKLEIIKTVTEHMKESNPNKEITPLSLLCSEIYNASGPKFDKKIPPVLLAPLIKYILLDYKTTNKKIRAGLNEIKKGQDEYRQSLWQIGSGKANSFKTTTSTKAASANKSKKSVKGSLKEKCFTKLRKRGEEWKDVDWIDDAPIDGPKLYVTISTLLEPLLPAHLLNFNIPINAIIRLNIIETPSFSHASNEDSLPFILQSRLRSLAEFKRKSTPYLSLNIGKHIDNEQMKKITMKSYWNKIYGLKNDKETAPLFKDIMFLQFVPTHQDFDYEVEIFQDEIYKQVSYFLYDAFETSKNHIAYLNEIEVVSVLDTNICNLPEMRIYNAILGTIPHEVLNVPLILDAIVTQVCELNRQDKDTGVENEGAVKDKDTGVENEGSVKTLSLHSNGSCKYLINLLGSLNLSYDLFHEHVTSSRLEDKNDTNISGDKRILLKHGDEIRIKSFHFEEGIRQYVTDRTNHILRLGWENVLFNYDKFSPHDETFSKMCNEIIKVEEQTGHQGLYYFLYILITNSILNSLILFHYKSDCKFNTLNEDVTEYDKENLCKKCFEEVFAKCSVPNSNTQSKSSSVSCFSNSSCAYRLGDDVIATNLFYIEEMTSDILLQRIQNIACLFSNVESRTCPFTDQIVLLFHNLVNPRSLSTEQKWMGKIRTKIPIRDFVDFIIQEEEDWLALQNNPSNIIYMKHADTFSSSMHEMGPGFILMLSDLDFISYRSIKYQIMMKKHSKKSSVKLSTPRAKGSRSKSQSKSSMKSSTKIKKIETSKVSKSNEVKSIQKVNSVQEVQRKKYKFLGYDIGDTMRFQYNGWKKDLILDDDCKVVLKSTKQLYSDEYRSAIINIYDNNLYINFNPNNLDDNYYDSFHLILTSGIILYFWKRHKNHNFAEEPTNSFKLYNVGVPSMMDFYKTEDANTVINVEQNVKLPSEINNENSQIFHSIAYEIQKVDYSQISTAYNVKMSTPSGLYVEVVQDHNMFYIRQSLLTKGQTNEVVKQEKYRCCLPDGLIVKCMINGDFEVLCGNGAIFHIYKEKTNLLDDLSHLEDSLHKKEVSLNSEMNLESKNILADDDNNDDPSKRVHVQKGSKRKESSDSKKKDKKESLTLENQQQMEETTVAANTVEEYGIYKHVESHGKCHLNFNNLSKILPSLFTSSSSDLSNNCINNEREDGVKSKYLADGSLIVDYPDGCRITSTPFESDGLFSAWTPDQFESWFTFNDETKSIEMASNKTVEMKFSATGKNSLRPSNASVTFSSGQKNAKLDDIHEVKVRERISTKNSVNSIEKNSAMMHTSASDEKSGSDYVDKTITKPSFVDDSFVVYSLSYLIEHPNYGSVHYDAVNGEMKLGMPMNTSLRLKNDGTYNSSFEGANLNVFEDSIDFTRKDKEETALRTITINTGLKKSLDSHKPQVFDLNSKFQRRNTSDSNITSHVEYYKTDLKNLSPYNNFFLYSINSLNTEIFIDYDLNYYKIPSENVCSKAINGKDFSCFVVNKDLSGFELIGDNEVEDHLYCIIRENGVVIRSENKWSSLLSILPVKVNESSKWLMGYEINELLKLPHSKHRSTYGRRESWIYPFVEVEREESKLNLCDPLILRALHRIPTDKNTLNDLESALEMFKTSTRSVEEKKINVKTYIHDLNLADILSNPSLLDEIYEDEMKKRGKAVDEFRTKMKDYFLISIMNQACIKARKRRIKSKENELKSALRNKEIPPYQLSCFGQVLGILDELVTDVTAKPTASSHSSVNCIIDEILAMTVDYKSQRESESVVVEGIFNEIFQKAITLGEEKMYVNRILEKPLSLVTNEEIEFLCTRFQPGSKANPTIYIDDIILKDILDARFQLSHYFENLKCMFKYYRSRNVNPEIA